jgi:hypothetical protein
MMPKLMRILASGNDRGCHTFWDLMHSNGVWVFISEQQGLHTFTLQLSESNRHPFYILIGVRAILKCSKFRKL